MDHFRLTYRGTAVSIDNPTQYSSWGGGGGDSCGVSTHIEGYKGRAEYGTIYVTWPGHLHYASVHTRRCGRPSPIYPTVATHPNIIIIMIYAQKGAISTDPEHVPRSPPSGHNDNMDTCPVLKRTHESEDRTPHQSGTRYASTLDPPTPLIVDTCRFRACAPTRTSEPCPNLGLDLWCRGTCVRFAR